jgi:hypothetical protein
MAGSTHIPNSPACGQWETLLADALDGLLRPEDETTFSAHMAICPACTALFEESRRGREWLEFLSTEPEVPAGLLDKILAATGPGQVAGYGLVTDVLPIPQPWQRPGFMARLRRFAEPRLMMTAAMAFFSIALTLNLTGVRLSDLHVSNLRPTAIRSFMERRLTMASTPIVRYYDHLRLVYEVQARMRELRRSTQGQGGQGEGTPDQQQSNPQPAAPGESKQNPPVRNPPHKDGGSRVDPPQQSGVPAIDDPDYLETSLTLTNQFIQPEKNWTSFAAFEAGIHFYNSSSAFALKGSTRTAREGSTVWTA